MNVNLAINILSYVMKKSKNDKLCEDCFKAIVELDALQEDYDNLQALAALRLLQHYGEEKNAELFG